MDNVQALHSFWSSFGVAAIDEQSAYDNKTIEELEIDYPYISYEVATDSFDNAVSIGADIWDRSTAWDRITQLAKLINAGIGRGGKIVPYDDGALWITRGAPFSQRMDAQDVSSAGGYDLRRIHININVEYLSA
ncbi:MAG: hypothetical protein IJG87_06470 [Ruminococcus sp.]|nr:hypothetical protein [Ruminococcus sp.]